MTSEIKESAAQNHDGQDRACGNQSPISFWSFTITRRCCFVRFKARAEGFRRGGAGRGQRGTAGETSESAARIFRWRRLSRGCQNLDLILGSSVGRSRGT